MPTSPPINAQLAQTATLADLRPRKITQELLAQALGKRQSTISRWENGIDTDGISPDDIAIMSTLFNREAGEIVLAAINTKNNPPKKEGRQQETN